MKNCPYCAIENEDTAAVCRSCKRMLPMLLSDYPSHNETAQLSKSDHDSLRDYLIGLREHFEHYHERKENMAWAAATVYLAAMSALASILYGGDGKFQPLITSRLSLMVAVLLTFGFALKFIRKQFADRNIAAHLAAACGEALSILVSPGYTISYLQARATPYNEGGNKYIWPSLLCERLQDDEFRQPDKPNWNELSPVLIIIVWTAAVAAIGICWPSECSSNPRQIFWIVIFVILQIVVLWVTRYLPVIWRIFNRKKQKHVHQPAA